MTTSISQDASQDTALAIIGMSGRFYLVGAVLLGLAYLYAGTRLTRLGLPVSAPVSKLRARQLLQASVLYLPLLFALMMTNSLRP